ncbi:hypothetical protein [Bosea sp. (in: a-proteobacteria)]|uniref:hypothetical protein n=1 Tax=Bosea sp. (in: a-proteobacteria) TaxID=1871050 RepID=UPI001ACC44BD|nr:hypothetical protein [Bosea sp. (in: a-proteobacteria)]MBN9438237.1 hypothetical protein [Bosea sp. (in: a-proteobacteria)]
MVAAIRARRIELGLSQLAVDELAGLPSGYQGKLEASLTNPGARNARGLGRDSLPLVLGVLGLQIFMATEDRSPAPMPESANKIKAKSRARFKTLADRGRKGGQIWWARLTEKQRAAAIRKLNRARAAKRAAKRAANQKSETK